MRERRLDSIAVHRVSFDDDKGSLLAAANRRFDVPAGQWKSSIILAGDWAARPEGITAVRAREVAEAIAKALEAIARLEADFPDRSGLPRQAP